MKLLINKEGNEIITKISVGENVIDFDYIKLINAIYQGEKIELVAENFSKEEKERFSELLEKITLAAGRRDDETGQKV